MFGPLLFCELSNQSAMQHMERSREITRQARTFEIVVGFLGNRADTKLGTVTVRMVFRCGCFVSWPSPSCLFLLKSVLNVKLHFFFFKSFCSTTTTTILNTKKHINSNNISVVHMKRLSGHLLLLSHFKMRHLHSTFFSFFTLQETLKQHFIPILLPWNAFSQGEFNIFFAWCATMMDCLDCRSQCWQDGGGINSSPGGVCPTWRLWKCRIINLLNACLTLNRCTLRFTG